MCEVVCNDMTSHCVQYAYATPTRIILKRRSDCFIDWHPYARSLTLIYSPRFEATNFTFALHIVRQVAPLVLRLLYCRHGRGCRHVQCCHRKRCCMSSTDVIGSGAIVCLHCLLNMYFEWCCYVQGPETPPSCESLPWNKRTPAELTSLMWMT